MHDGADAATPRPDLDGILANRTPLFISAAGLLGLFTATPAVFTVADGRVVAPAGITVWSWGRPGPVQLCMDWLIRVMDRADLVPFALGLLNVALVMLAITACRTQPSPAPATQPAPGREDAGPGQQSVPHETPQSVPQGRPKSEPEDTPHSAMQEMRRPAADVTRRSIAPAPRRTIWPLPVRESIAAAFVLLWLWPRLGWTDDPSTAFIALLWVNAAAAARQRKNVTAAVAAGLAGAIAPWGLLGLPVLLSSGRVRLALRTAALSGVIGACAYLPFAFGGDLSIFRSPVTPQTRMPVVGSTLAFPAWQAETIEALVICAGCGYLAWAYRRHRLIVALAPASAGLLLIATAPIPVPDIWVVVGVCTIGCLVIGLGDPRRHVRRGVVLLAYLAWAAYVSRFQHTVLISSGCLVLVLMLARGTRAGPTTIRKMMTAVVQRVSAALSARQRMS